MPPGAPRQKPTPLPRIPDHPGWTVSGGMISPTSPTLQIHDILRASQSRFYYDIAKHPSTLIFAKNQPASTLSVLNEPATFPILCHLYIEVPASRHISIPIFNPTGLTILDILNGLYNALHSPIVFPAIDDIGVPSSLLMSGKRHRSHSDQNYPGSPETKPVPERQIRFLQGRTMFAGLKIDRVEGGVWILRLHTASTA